MIGFRTVEISRAADTADTALRPLTPSSALRRPFTDSGHGVFVNGLEALLRARMHPETKRHLLDAVQGGMSVRGAGQRFQRNVSGISGPPELQEEPQTQQESVDFLVRYELAF